MKVSPLEMRGQVVRKALKTRTQLSGCVRMFEGQGIDSNDHNQHQQNGHHAPGYPLDAALHAIVYDQRRYTCEEQGKQNRREGEVMKEVK